LAGEKLTTLAVRRQKTPGRYGDGAGLWLQVAPKGGKSWLFRYMRDGKARHMGLGPVEIVSLANAREMARDARKLLFHGQDPIQARDAARAAARTNAARGITFKESAEKLIAAQESGWRNRAHRAQWKSTLATYAYPTLGDLPVSAVDVAMVMKVLEPIWRAKPETAGRVRGRIEAVLDWASARGFRSGENPARWRGHLDKLLPARSKIAKVKHHAALPYAELPDFMDKLRREQGVSPRGLEFAILTAARTNEAVRARWSEINLTTRMWTVPAERMKGNREHRVPLADRAVEILEGLPRESESDHVFIGNKVGQPLSNMALLMTLRRMGRDDLTAHGFRSTFKDWATETTAYPVELSEMALAHIVSDKTEAAYRRGDMIEKRRRLMADWAAYCSSPARSGDNVRALRGVAQ
jgi:integrase